MPPEIAGQLGLALAEQAKAKHQAKHSALLANIRSSMALKVLDQGRVTADDAHDYLDFHGYPANFGGNRRFLGAVFNSDFRATGEWVTSRRAVNHGRPIRVWGLR
jgi:hypothetical protein